MEPGLLRYALSLPPRVLARKAVRRLRRAASRLTLRLRDRILTSYAASTPEAGLCSYFPRLSPDRLGALMKPLAPAAGLYLDHRFDLLGSGWTSLDLAGRSRGLNGVRYQADAPPPGADTGAWLAARLGRANRRKSLRLRSLISPPKTGYAPIDWQRDFKSGYRFDANCWYASVPIGRTPGVDIKVPWELARMQHMPQLALVHAANVASTGPGSPQALEFRNQVLDFIAANPPRFGVNWVCPMDVGIRAANLLLARDIFVVHGARFDAAFEQTFARSMLEHGRHIAANLEWREEDRSNHYLADVAGLLFIAAYVPDTPETDCWLAFAVQELAAECKSQFHEDGSNYEASTGYHRLSAEMVLYAATLTLGLPEHKRLALSRYDKAHWRGAAPLAPAPLPLYPLPGIRTGAASPLPPEFFARLYGMAAFTMAMTKPDGRVVQVGDNDSGRFFKLQPALAVVTAAQAKARYASLDGYSELPDTAAYPDEDILDHHHLVAAIDGLYADARFGEFAGLEYVERDIVRAIALGSGPVLAAPGPAPASPGQGSDRDLQAALAVIESRPPECRRRTEITLPRPLTPEDISLARFPDFGAYVLKTSWLYLHVRCVATGAKGLSGHGHDDNLTIELTIDGRDRIADPGSYLYTPAPATRNAYRERSAHFAPLGAVPAATMSEDLFALRHEASARCLCFGQFGFAGVLEGKDWTIRRVVEVKANALVISDAAEGAAAPLQPSGARSRFVSAGYGKLTFEPAARL